MAGLAAVEVSPVVQMREQRRGKLKEKNGGLENGDGKGDDDGNGGEGGSNHDGERQGEDSTPAIMAGLINKGSLSGAGAASVSGSGSGMGQKERQEEQESVLKRIVNIVWPTSFADREQRQQGGDLQENKEPKPGAENMEIGGEPESARMSTGVVDARTDKEADVEVDVDDGPGYESIPSSATSTPVPTAPPILLSAVRVASEPPLGDINPPSLPRVSRETSRPATSGDLTIPNLSHKDIDISGIREKSTRARSSGKPDTYDVVVSPERQPQQSRKNPNPVKHKRGPKPKQPMRRNGNEIMGTIVQEQEQEVGDHTHISTEGLEDGISIRTRKRTRSQSATTSSPPRKRTTRANEPELPMALVDDSKRTENLVANRNPRFERPLSQQPRKREHSTKYPSPEGKVVPVANEHLGETATEMVERGLRSNSVVLDSAVPASHVLNLVDMEKNLPDNRDCRDIVDPGRSNMEPPIGKSPATQKRSERLVPKTPISAYSEQLPKASNKTPKIGAASTQPAKANTPARKRRNRQSIPEETDEQYQERLEDRLKMQKKDTFFKRERRRLGLPPVGSQAESSSSTQSPEATSSQPLETDQSAEKQRYRVPHLDNSEEIYQKKFAERLEMQRRDTFFKRSRQIFGLPPVGSQQTQFSNEPSLANISLVRHPSSTQQFEQQSSGPTPVDLVIDLDSTYTTSQAREIQRQLLNVREQQRRLTTEERKLEDALQEAINSGASGGEPVDADERLLGMFGTKQPTSMKPKKWTPKEMALLIEGLRYEQGPDRYELIHETMPDRSFDEIFDMAKTFKETMIERDKETRLRNPFKSHPPLEEFIQNIGLELSAL